MLVTVWMSYPPMWPSTGIESNIILVRIINKREYSYCEIPVSFIDYLFVNQRTLLHWGAFLRRAYFRPMSVDERNVFSFKVPEMCLLLYR